MSARVRAANPRRKRRRWPHALWVLPVLCAIPVGVRVRSYDVPVFAFAPEAGAPRALAGAMHLHSLRSDGRSRGAPILS